MLSPNNTSETVQPLYYRFFIGGPGTKPITWHLMPVFIPGLNPSDAWQKYREARGQLMKLQTHEKYNTWLSVRGAIAYQKLDENRLAALSYEPVARWWHTGPGQWECKHLSSLKFDDIQTLVNL